LPWEGLKASTENKRNEYIKENKINISIEDLCYSLPDAFTSYFNYVRTLGFDEQPDYSYCHVYVGFMDCAEDDSAKCSWASLGLNT
jgi:hypothetical protein